MSNLTPEQARELLEVASDASPDEIKSAYRKLALEHHPDRNPDDLDAEAKFKAVGEAYATLTQPTQKQVEFQPPTPKPKSFLQRAQEKAGLNKEQIRQANEKLKQKAQEEKDRIEQKRRDREESKRQKIINDLIYKKRIANRRSRERQREKRILERERKIEEKDQNEIGNQNASSTTTTTQREIRYVNLTLDELIKKQLVAIDENEVYKKIKLQYENIESKLEFDINNDPTTIAILKASFNCLEDDKIIEIFNQIKTKGDTYNTRYLTKIIQTFNKNLQDAKIKSDYQIFDKINQTNHYKIIKKIFKINTNIVNIESYIDRTFDLLPQIKIKDDENLNNYIKTLNQVIENRGSVYLKELLYLLYITNEYSQYTRINFTTSLKTFSQTILEFSKKIENIYGPSRLINELSRASCEYKNDDFNNQKEEFIEVIKNYTHLHQDMDRIERSKRETIISALQEFRYSSNTPSNNNASNAPLKLPLSVCAYAITKLTNNYDEIQIEDLGNKIKIFRGTNYYKKTKSNRKIIEILTDKEKELLGYLRKCYIENPSRRLTEQNIDKILEIQFQ